MKCVGIFHTSYTLGFLCLFFIPRLLFPQIDTTLKDYFPMHIGDYWEILSLGDSWETSTITWEKVVGDTVMSNGKSYRVFKIGTLYPLGFTDTGTICFRIDDSMRVWNYRGSWSQCEDSGEILWYDLKARDSSMWSVCWNWNQRYLMRSFVASYEGLNLTLPSKLFACADVVSPSGDTTISPIGSPEDFLGKGIGIVRQVAELYIGDVTGAIINGVKYGTLYSAVDDKIAQLPHDFTLLQNYPNPFNPSTTIEYDLPRRMNVQLSVYDVLGRTVATLVNEFQAPGQHRAKFDASRLDGGVYFYRLSAGNFSETKKLILMK